MLEIIIFFILFLIIIFFIYKNIFFYNLYNCNQFIYNIAWEDPSIDFKYLEINNNDIILMITTAGCNVLNTLLQNPKNIISVDISKCQNALLDLKLASIKNLDFDIFWNLFGVGKYQNFKELYYQKLRNDLQLTTSKDFWDNNINIFNIGLYNSGTAIKTMKYSKLFLSNKLLQLCEFNNIDEQYKYYKSKIEPIIFNKFIFYIVNTPLWRKLSGVPLEQYNTICGGKYSKEKIYNFMKNNYDFIFKNKLIKKENYFAYASIKGEFTKSNCPEYLKEENFSILKENIHKIKIVNSSVTNYLKNNDTIFTKFILLDHLDWFKNKTEVIEEFELIKKNSNDCIGIFRSGSEKPWYLTHIIELNFNLNNLSFERENDRLGTYLGFYLFYK